MKYIFHNTLLDKDQELKMLDKIIDEIEKINEQDKDYPILVETMEELYAGVKAEHDSIKSD